MDVKEKLDSNKKPCFEITSPKLKSTIKVQRTQDGYSFYEIVTTGKTPQMLEGKFLTCDDALKFVKNYLNSITKTLSKRRDDTYEENHPVGSGDKSDDKE